MDYFTSDPHFGHENVIRFCARPFQSLTQMHERLIENYNSRVKETDRCFFLGDVFFNKHAEAEILLKQMHGEKILIQGNHDNLSHTQYLRIGFSMVLQEAVIKINGNRVTLSHFPFWPNWYQRLFIPRADLRCERSRPVDRGQWLLHGHVHKAWFMNGKQINVGVDRSRFYPISQTEIQSIMDKNPNGLPKR